MADIRALINRRDNLAIDRELILASLETAQLRARNNLPGGVTQVASLQAQLAAVDRQLAEVNLQIAQLRGGPPTASTGNLVKEDAQATVSNAAVQRPTAEPLLLNEDGRIVQVPDTTTGTNALRSVNENSVDRGTNASLRSLNNTQATDYSNQQGGTPLTNPSIDDRSERPVAGGQNAGVGAAPDDRRATGTNATRVEIDNIFNEVAIEARPNVLDQYASYNYVASVYLMTPQSYRTMIQSKQKSITGAQLLFQSGGVPENQRFGNGIFDNDYYIDRLQLTSRILGKGSGAAHNVYDMTMTVVEPNGISLISNLDRAVTQFLDKNVASQQSVVLKNRQTAEQIKNQSFNQQIYLLAVRFYGYDDQGKLVRGGVARPDGSSDPNAFVEKFYPFIIKNVKFRIANKLTEYTIECSTPFTHINSSTARGTIPYNIELSGQTLKDLLSGPAQYASNQTAVTRGGNSSLSADQTALLEELERNAPTPGNTAADQLNGIGFESLPTGPSAAPAKANAAPTAKKTIRQGLMAAMNEYQSQLVKDGIYDIADVYSIEFVNESLANAKTTKKGPTNKKSTANSVNTTAADQLLGNKQSMDKTARTQSVTAGLQIVQFLDQVIRNSSYIEDQQLVTYKEGTGEEMINGTPAQNVAWYKISMEATPIGNAKDAKRNDYAYNIKFKIHAYKLADLVSPYFVRPKFIGVVKRYPYWFTGENNAVISYEENFNNLYQITLSGTGSKLTSNFTSNLNDMLTFNYQTRSSESSQGADLKTNEPPSNAAEFLYSPTDLQEVNMTIVGDPAWLQQGEAFAGFSSSNPQWGAFLADGTINTDAQQVMFEVSFNTPRDYNLSTGLIVPNPDGATQKQNNYQAQTVAQQSRVYRAYEVISEFAKGKFTQLLKGKLILNPITPEKVAQTQVVRETTTSGTPATVAGIATTAGYRQLLAKEAAGGFTTRIPPTSANSQAAVNFLAEQKKQITTPSTPPSAPTSSGQPIPGRTFAQDVAARQQGILTNPQRTVRDQ
jgi:hypothetical protein